MGFREEKQELIRSIAQLEQALGQSRAKVLTLRPRVEASTVSFDRCVELRDISRESLDYMKKNDIIFMEDYKDMLSHYEHNKELAVKYKNEIFMYEKMLQASVEEVTATEKVLATVTKQAECTAIIIPFER